MHRGMPMGSGSMEWVTLDCSDIPPRNSHAAVLHGDMMIIIGGASPEGQTDEVYAIDLSNRSNVTCRRICCQPFEPGSCTEPSESAMYLPAAREMLSACLVDSKIIEGAATTILIMGGRSPGGVLQDLFSLSTGTVDICWEPFWYNPSPHQ